MNLRTSIALLPLLSALGWACTSGTTTPPPGQTPDDSGTTPPQKDAAAIVPPLPDAGGDGGFTCNPPAPQGSLYALSARNLADTRDVSMCEFRGKVMLIVNVASYCGYTPQYAPLQTLWETYKAQGFYVLGFPCNQFGSQEPGDAAAISDFCTTQYGITFPMFGKIEVNGANTHPIYQWLKAQPGATGDIPWNFSKFLVGRDGKVAKRWEAATTPDSAEVKTAIEAELAK
jgi:glutathione peroxidase